MMEKSWTATPSSATTHNASTTATIASSTSPPPPPSSSSHLIFKLILILLVVIMNNNKVNADCPKLCDCKWKNGKETVLCMNVNLTIIPPNLDPGTQVLDLTGNDIAKIYHDQFLKVGLINLQKIYLAKCKLKMIDRYAFRKVINLVELDLSYNVLNVVPSQIFGSIGELRELKLNGNPITRLTNDAFVNVPQLFRLELSNCKISAVERNAFAGIEISLEWLKVDGNKLMEFESPSTLSRLENLNGIELNRNPWNCTCAIKPIIQWLYKFKISQTLVPTCRYPLRLLNKSWDRLKLDEFACLPQITTTTDKFDEIEGSNATLRCDFIETPDPIITWRFNNKIINLDKKFHLHKKFMINWTERSTNLTVFDVDPGDTGIYVCAIENKAGKVEKSIYMEVSVNSGLSNFHKILVFIIFFIFIFFIIFLTFVSSIFLWRRKRKTTRKNYKKSNHDYEKIDRFNLTTSTTGNSISGGGSGGGSGGSGDAGGGQTMSSTSAAMELCSSVVVGGGASSNISFSGGSGGGNSLQVIGVSSGSGMSSNQKIVKVEDFPLRQYREYKHIPSEDDEEDEDDEDNEDDDGDDDDEDEENENTNLELSRHHHINNKMSRKNRKTKNMLLNNLTKCRSGVVVQTGGKSNKKSSSNGGILKTTSMTTVLGGATAASSRTTTNKWISDVHQDDKETKTTSSSKAKISLEGNSHRGRDQNIKRHNNSTKVNTVVGGGVGYEDDDEQFFSGFSNKTFDHMSTMPMKGFKPNFTQHIMTKRGSLFTSEPNEDDEVDGLERHGGENSKYDPENQYPDLLDLPKFNQNYYENYFNVYSTLPITKTINSTNYHKSKINSDDSQASLLSSSSNEAVTKFVPSGVATMTRGKLRARRYSVDSYSYMPSSSMSSSSSFSLMTTTSAVTTAATMAKQNFYSTKQRSSSYLNLVQPPTAETKFLRTYPSLPSSPSKSNNNATSSSSTATLLSSSLAAASQTNAIGIVGNTHHTTLTNYTSSNKTLGIPSNATPLLDFSSLPIHTRISASFIENPSASSKLLYDYHTTQLEYFIQEYRKLQQQLKKIGGLSIPSPTAPSNALPLHHPTSSSPSSSKEQQNSIGQSAKFADPLMFNEAWLASTTVATDMNIDAEDDGIMKNHHPLHPQHQPHQHQPQHTQQIPPTTSSILKKKQLVNWNKSPDPPPYWLHRNAMLKQLNSNPPPSSPTPAATQQPPQGTATSSSSSNGCHNSNSSKKNKSAPKS